MEESKDVNMGCEYKVSPAVSDDGGVCLSLADRSPASATPIRPPAVPHAYDSVLVAGGCSEIILIDDLAVVLNWSQSCDLRNESNAT